MVPESWIVVFYFANFTIFFAILCLVSGKARTTLAQMAKAWVYFAGVSIAILGAHFCVRGYSCADGNEPVLSIAPGSAAERAGLLPGDKILRGYKSEGHLKLELLRQIGDGATVVDVAVLPPAEQADLSTLGIELPIAWHPVPLQKAGKFIGWQIAASLGAILRNYGFESSLPKTAPIIGDASLPDAYATSNSFLLLLLLIVCPATLLMTKAIRALLPKSASDGAGSQMVEEMPPVASPSLLRNEVGASFVSQLVLLTTISLIAVSTLGFVNNTWTNREANRAKLVGRIADRLCEAAGYSDIGIPDKLRFDPARFCCAYELPDFPIQLPCES